VPSKSVKKGAAGIGDSIRRLQRGKVADPAQHAKSRLREKARKDIPQDCRVLNLVAITDDDRHRHYYPIESGADIFNHAGLRPSPLSAGRSAQCVPNDLLTQLG
jgi:hypothetical protein